MALKDESNRFWSLNVAEFPIRVSSVFNSVTSVLIAVRSVAVLVSLTDWTARSRIRCKMAVDSSKAPSAVWLKEIASLALRTAWVKPLICESIRLVMDRPAASSMAELIRLPEDRRSIEFSKSLRLDDK